MANEMQGISALDPRVAATEKFINENNIPPAEVPGFLLSMGADPKLASLVFKYRRLQEATQGQQGPPPVSTVAQDVDQQYAQMSGGVASLPAPAMDAAQFQGGIMPPQAPPQGMAGGGIVALSNGGVLPSGSTIHVNPSGVAQVGVGRGREIVSFDEINRTYQDSSPEIKAKILEWARKNMPSFAKFIESGYVQRGANVLGKAATRVGAPIAGGFAGYRVGQADRDEGVLAEEYGFNPDIFGAQTAAKGIGLFEELADDLTLGLYGAGRKFITGEEKRPVERAIGRTTETLNRIERGGVRSNLTESQKAAANQYSQIVKDFGANSEEARQFERDYKEATQGSVSGISPELASLLQTLPSGENIITPSEFKISTPKISETDAERRLESRLKQFAPEEDFLDPKKRSAMINQEMAENISRFREMGLFEPYEKAKGKAEKRLKELEGIKDKNFYKAMAMMGFTMAQTRGSFFEALAAGGATGLGAYETFEQRRQDMVDKVEDRILNIDMNIANLQKEAGTAATSRIDKLESDRNNLATQLTSLEAAREQLQATMAGQVAIANAQIAAQVSTAKAQIDAKGGLSTKIENDIAELRELLKRPDLSPSVKAEAERRLQALYAELEKATQAGSGRYKKPEDPLAKFIASMGGGESGVNAAIEEELARRGG